MFGIINDLFDKKGVDKYVTQYSPEYKKIRNITGVILLTTFLLPITVTIESVLANKAKDFQAFIYNEELNRTKEIQPLVQPDFSSERLGKYVETIINKIFETSFATIDRQFDSYEKYFTPLAWDLFKVNVNEDFLAFVKEKSLVSKVYIIKEPLLVDYIPGIDGSQRWVFNLKMFISYTGSTKTASNVLNDVKITLLRANTAENPNGILIDKLIVSKNGKLGRY